MIVMGAGLVAWRKCSHILSRSSAGSILNRGNPGDDGVMRSTSIGVKDVILMIVRFNALVTRKDRCFVAYIIDLRAVRSMDKLTETLTSLNSPHFRGPVMSRDLRYMMFLIVRNYCYVALGGGSGDKIPFDGYEF